MNLTRKISRSLLADSGKNYVHLDESPIISTSASQQFFLTQPSTSTPSDSVDKELINKLIGPTRFLQFLGCDEPITVDKRYFDEEDFRNHRHEYARMHRTLESLDPHQIHQRLPPGQLSDDKTQLKKRKRKRMKVSDAFQPTLSKLTEVQIASGPSRFSSDDRDGDADKKNDDPMAGIRSQEPKPKRAHVSMVPKYVYPEDEEDSQITFGRRVPFLEEIASESHPSSFLDFVGLSQRPEPNRKLSERDHGQSVLQNPPMSTKKDQKLSFGIPISMSPDNSINADRNSLNRVTSDHNSSEKPEYYAAKDLQQRTFSGIELRELNPPDYKAATEHEEAVNLGDADLEHMHQHRFEEHPGISNWGQRDNVNRCRSVSMIGFNPPPFNSSWDRRHPSSAPGASKLSRSYSPLYIQLDQLKVHPRIDQPIWQEIVRWVEFEQTYNEDSSRFDRAHSSPLKFQTLSHFKRVMDEGAFILTPETNSYFQACQYLLAGLDVQLDLSTEESKTIYQLLQLPHQRAGEKFPVGWDPVMERGVHPKYSIASRHTLPEISEVPYDTNTPPLPQSSLASRSTSAVSRSMSHRSGTSSSIRRRKQSLLQAFINPAFQSDLEGRLKPGTETAIMLVGEIENLKRPLIAFVRLAGTIVKPNMTEMDALNIRYIFIAIGPPDEDIEYDEIGRVMGTCLTDKEMQICAFNASDKEELMKGVHNFLDDCVVVPILSEVTPDTLSGMYERIQFYKHAIKQKERLNRAILGMPLDEFLDENVDDLMVMPTGEVVMPGVTVGGGDTGEVTKDGMPIVVKTKKSRGRQCLSTFCPPFVTLYRDFIGLKGRYISDFADFAKKENYPIVLLGILFVYFAVLAPAITFGALMSINVSKEMTVTVSLVANGIFVLLFGLFGGQPIIIVGISAPLFIMEVSISTMSQSLGVVHPVLRFWVAIYAFMWGLIVVGGNLVEIVKHIRRSVEEIFNAFIGIFFILKSIFSMTNLVPVRPSIPRDSNFTNTTSIYLAFSERNAKAGVNFFLSFVMLMVCLSLVELKKGNFLRRRARTIIGSLNVPISITLVVILNLLLFPTYNLTTLSIPAGTSNTSLWFNIPPLSQLSTAGSMVHATAFGLGFLTMLLILAETALSGVSIAKAERKLTKPCLFTVDFFLLLMVFPIMSGFLGWPFVSGTIVRSNSHAMAMTKMNINTPPGVPHKVIGMAEQRISCSVVGLLVFLSIFLAVILQLIPMAAMYGMFLYMGVMGLRDLHVINRIFYLIKRRKYWLDEVYLRNLPSHRIIAFVVFQCSWIVLLVALNCITEFANTAYPSLIFPIIIIIYALVREFILPFWRWLNTYLTGLDPIHPIALERAKVRKIKTVDGTLHTIPGDTMISFNPTIKPDSRVDIQNPTEELKSPYGRRISRISSGVINLAGPDFVNTDADV